MEGRKGEEEGVRGGGGARIIRAHVNVNAHVGGCIITLHYFSLIIHNANVGGLAHVKKDCRRERTPTHYEANYFLKSGRNCILQIVKRAR